jgi:hypothetical protein
MGLEYRRLRAPAGNGGALKIPDIAGSRQMLQDNETTLAGHHFAVDGIPIASLRQTARRELVAIASRYTRQYLDIEVQPTKLPERLFVSGHQPVLFHPGVWFKNFRLDHLSRLCGGTAINVQIDNDLCTSKSIRVPCGSASHPKVELVPFDHSHLMLPFECQKIEDAGCFQSFADRVRHIISGFVPRPLIGEYWKKVLVAARELTSPFAAIAAGRHILERSIGLNSLEVPLGQLCDTGSFCHFAAELLAHHCRFRELFNSCLTEFRQVHRIRSRSHPVPELELRTAPDGPAWTEAPFWVWTDADPRRRRLMVRSNGNSIQLAHDGNWFHSFPAAALLDELQGSAERGIRIRPRAVTTTMYLRLVLADYFIHGIGGAKYDQLTDQIIESFFGPPPSIAIVTSTHLLPTGLAAVSSSEMQSMHHRLRDFDFNPDRYIDPAAAELAGQIGEKRKLLASIPGKGHRKSWRERIRAINASLQPALEQQRSGLSDELNQSRSAMEVERILGSREFAWPLFPESLIEELRKLACT